MTETQFEGQTAIVTGAAKGIGRAVAEKLMKAGVAVSLWDIDEQALIKMTEELSSFGEFQKVVVDCAKPDSVSLAWAETEMRFPRIDILIANAGVAGVMKPAWEHSLDDWNRLIEQDLNSVFLTTRLAVPKMIDAGYGRIVIVSSIAGLEGAAGNAAYAAAKAGAIGYGKALGKELATTGVIANVVAPSGIATPLLDDVSEDYMAKVLEKMPMGRLGTAEEAAHMIVWLASKECSFSTGAVFDISGGRAVY